MSIETVLTMTLMTPNYPLSDAINIKHSYAQKVIIILLSYASLTPMYKNHTTIVNVFSMRDYSIVCPLLPDPLIISLCVKNTSSINIVKSTNETLKFEYTR